MRWTSIVLEERILTCCSAIFVYITSLKSSTDSFTSHPQVQIDISEYEKKGFQKRRPKEGSKNKPV
jgi:hypothetical protein